jgi:hypothetical protein
LVGRVIPSAATAVITTATSIRFKVSTFIPDIAFSPSIGLLPFFGRLLANKRHKKEVAGLVSGVGRVVCLERLRILIQLKSNGGLCASTQSRNSEKKSKDYDSEEWSCSSY